MDAQAVLQDLQEGRAHEAQVLAGLGAGGQGRRAFNSLLDKLDYGLSPYTWGFSCNDPLLKQTVKKELPVLLPHEIVGALYSGGWTMFSNVLLGGIPESRTVVRWVPLAVVFIASCVRGPIAVPRTDVWFR